jgi:zinc transporter, ZIP family
MPPALQTGPPVLVALAMFAGGCIFLAMEFLAAQRESREPETKAPRPAIGLFLGVLIDMVIDGVAIGVGSTLTLGTGVLLALGMAVSTAPLAFVTIATAKHRRCRRGSAAACRSHSSWPCSRGRSWVIGGCANSRWTSSWC